MPNPILLSGQILIDSSATRSYWDPHSTGLATGGFIVSYTSIISDTDYDAVANIRDYQGGAFGFFRGNGVNGDGREQDPALADGLTGAGVIVFSDNSASTSNDIILQQATFGPGSQLLASPAIQIANAAGNQLRPEVVRLSNGSYLVAWHDVQDEQIEARVWNPTTNSLSAVTVVAPAVGALGVRDLGLTALSNGGAAISWVRTGSPTTHSYAVLNESGGVVNGPIDISGFNSGIDIIQIADGRLALVAFVGNGNINVRFADASGANLSSPVVIANFGDYVAATPLLDGRMMIVGLAGTTIVGVIVTAAGVVDGNVFGIASGAASGTIAPPSLDTLHDGRVVVTWGDVEDDIRAVIYDPRETGVAITGTGLNDRYVGSGFADTFVLGGGNDTIDGGTGTDTLNGGAGTDTVTYASDGAAITARLDLGFGVDAGGAFDTYVDIENIVGSAFADVIVGLGGVANALAGGDGDDTIYGEGLDAVDGGVGVDTFFGGQGGALNLNLATAGIEVVWGSVASDTMNGTTASANLTLVGQGAGGDTMSGGSGNDFIYFRAGDSITGGTGTDWAVATLSPTGVTLNLTTTGFENAWGSTSADTFTAAASATGVTIVGDTGNDTITGGNGADFLYGFADADSLTGGLGNDQLFGGAGTDVFRFSAASFGTDTIWDFTAGDVINLNGTGIAGFGSLTLTLSGAHTVVTSVATGASAIWVLNNTALAAGDFVF